MSQITIDFSAAGLGTALKNGLKVIGYHVATDAILIAGAYLSNVQVTTHTAQEGAILAASIAVANALLKVVKDWLSTVAPSEDPISSTMVAELPTP